MIEDKKMLAAKTAFDTFCEMLDDLKFKYQKHDEDLVISFEMSGEDIPIPLIVYIDAESELVRVSSPIHGTFKEFDRVIASLAACYATSLLEDGAFELDYTSGKMYFRMIASFADSTLSKRAMQYLVYNSGTAVDDFNDNFLMLAKGKMTLDEFKAQYN